MKQWFEGLESRERIMLFAGVIVLAVFLFYGLVWQPFHSGYDRLHCGFRRALQKCVS